MCHHALSCSEYQHVCRGCQFLGSIKADLSTAVQALKSKLYARHPDIQFVAVSNWLAERASESRLLHNMALTVIPNAIDADAFGYERQRQGNLDISADKKVIAMGAARLDDTIKGFDLLISATRHLHDTRPELAKKLHLVLFGSIRDSSLLDQLCLPHTHLGTVKGIEALVNIYTQADVVLSTSRFETLPGTLVEGMACGCIPVSFGAGGQADIIDHLTTGYIAPEVEPEAKEVVNQQLKFSRMMINTMSLTDEQALEVKDLYPLWEDLIGTTVEKDSRLTYEGVLYKVLQEHEVQEQWKPGTDTASLYGIVSASASEEHAGTKEDPIPYVQMMVLEKGKYYTQDGVLYECIQGTVTGYPNDLKDLASLVKKVEE